MATRPALAGRPCASRTASAALSSRFASISRIAVGTAITSVRAKSGATSTSATGTPPTSVSATTSSKQAATSTTAACCALGRDNPPKDAANAATSPASPSTRAASWAAAGTRCNSATVALMRQAAACNRSATSCAIIASRKRWVSAAWDFGASAAAREWPLCCRADGRGAAMAGLCNSRLALPPDLAPEWAPALFVAATRSAAARG